MNAARLLNWVSALALALLLPPPATAAPRTWTAADGRTVDAELMGYDPDQGMAELKRADGQNFNFPISRLIETDRQRVLDIYLAEGDETVKRIDQLVRRRLGEPLNSQPYFTTLQAMVDRGPETDAEFLQRMTTAIIGRDATAEEIAAFEKNAAPDKRPQRIDELLDSEEFVKHFTDSFLAELLQVDGRRPAKLPYPECTGPLGTGKEKMQEARAGRRSNPQPELYREWVEQQVRDDKPWDQLVSELMTASGRYTENPATGYLIVNSREPYLIVNPAPVMTAFTGIELTCAQCHDHPEEEVYQMDFYKMAAFFSAFKVDMHKSDATTTGIDFEVSDDTVKALRLPPDYAYDDADPGQLVSASAYFGKTTQIVDASALRQEFADWLTDQSNPRFTFNITNRLWAYVFGHAPIQTVDNLPGHLAEASYDLRLANFLRDTMQRRDYQPREFLRALYRTETFSGIAAEQAGDEAAAESEAE